MKSYRKELFFNVPTRRAFINITSQVEQALHDSGIQEGLCLINPMHITASVFINDDEAGLHHDYDAWLDKIAPYEPGSQYRQNGVASLVCESAPLVASFKAPGSSSLRAERTVLHRSAAGGTLTTSQSLRSCPDV